MSRLALAALCLALLPAVASAKKSAAPDKDEQALQHYKLTLDNLRKAADVNEKLTLAAEKDPALAKQMKEREGSSDKSFDDLVQRMNATPIVKSTLGQVGLSARDYLLTTMAAIQAGMIAAMKKQDPKVQIPPEVNAENVAFVQAHEADFARLAERQKAFQKKHHLSEDGEQQDEPGEGADENK